MDTDEQRPLSDDSDDDPSDPVIRTLPVFFTPQMARHAMLLEYPHKKVQQQTSAHPLLAPSLRTQIGIADSSATRITARVKPKVGRMELSVPLDVEETEDQNIYNKERGHYMAVGVDNSADLGLEKPVKSTSRKRDREQYEDAHKLVTRMCLSGDVLADQTNYCVAALKDDQLHLTPLTQTLQMRPELSYLDRLSARSRQPGNANNADASSSSDDAEHDPERKERKAAARSAKAKALAAEARAVQVSIKADPATGGMFKGVATGRQDGTLFAPLRADESEPWTYLNHYPSDSGPSDAIWDAFFANIDTRLDLETHTYQHLSVAEKPVTLIV